MVSKSSRQHFAAHTHEQDAHDISLQQRLPVVFPVSYSTCERQDRGQSTRTSGAKRRWNYVRRAKTGTWVGKHGHKGDKTGNESADSSDDNDGTGEPSTSASRRKAGRLDGCGKGAYSHSGDAQRASTGAGRGECGRVWVGGRARRWYGGGRLAITGRHGVVSLCRPHGVGSLWCLSQHQRAVPGPSSPGKLAHDAHPVLQTARQTSDRAAPAQASTADSPVYSNPTTQRSYNPIGHSEDGWIQRSFRPSARHHARRPRSAMMPSLNHRRTFPCSHGRDNCRRALEPARRIQLVRTPCLVFTASANARQGVLG